MVEFSGRVHVESLAILQQSVIRDQKKVIFTVNHPSKLCGGGSDCVVYVNTLAIRTDTGEEQQNGSEKKRVFV